MDNIFSSNPMAQQFFELFEMPDYKFEAMYDEMKAAIIESLNSPATRNTIVEEFRKSPVKSTDGDEEELQQALADVDKEDLSPKKKELLKLVIQSSTQLVREVANNPRELVPVKIQKISPDAKIPEYAHVSDAGADVYSAEDVVIGPNSTTIVKTGIKIAIPGGYEIQVRPRSGMSAKTGIRVANAPGTIDSEYRGEVGIILHNTSIEPYEVKKGDKIAQLLIAPTPMIHWEEVEELDTTERNEGGFGSTDKS